MKEVLNRVLLTDRAGLMTILNDQQAPLIDLAVARLVEVCIKEGDTMRLNFLFDRLVGKVKEEVGLEIQEGRHPALAGIPTAILKKYAPKPTEPEE